MINWEKQASKKAKEIIELCKGDCLQAKTWIHKIIIPSVGSECDIEYWICISKCLDNPIYLRKFKLKRILK
jgi:NAD-dependent dihydropyrimidine dehydrogenase PreA subunit